MRNPVSLVCMYPCIPCVHFFLQHRRIHSPVPDSYLDSHHSISGPIHQVLLFIQSHTSSHHVSYLQYSNKSTYALMDHGNVSLTHWGKNQILSTSNVPNFLLMIIHKNSDFIFWHKNSNSYFFIWQNKYFSRSVQ